MTDDARVEHLLEELLDSRLTPEEVCRDIPDLLPAVRQRWLRMRSLEAEVEALFPARGTAHSPGGASRAPNPGELPRIDGYFVESVLGRGGMGVVYKARHLRLGRCVALKMLRSGEYAAPEQLARFAREAEVIAGLRHANIVQIFDVGDHEGRPWFTMELMEGGSLAQKLGGTPQPARRSAALVATLAEAIHAAHAGGVVHRDIKPANILLDAGGTPRISDFGLARRLEGNAELTLSGAALGTPSYMAPEQAAGKERLIGPAVDIYALGAMLYEMLTGRPPFRGETATETERQVISEEPVRPSRLNAKVPRDLETICLKCLQKDPARRYPSAAALAEDLHRFRRGEPIAARPASLLERAVKWVRRRPAQAMALLGGALLALGILGAVLWLGLQRAATVRAVNEDLRHAALREQSSDWAEARTAIERARARLGDGGPAALRDLVEQGARELELVARLDAVRLQRAAVVEGRFDMRANKAQADRAYEEAFHAAGFGSVGEDASAVAGRIADSSIHAALVAALDDWAICIAPEANDRRQDWLLDVARRANPDPTGWRNRVRDLTVWNDRETLTELARTAVANASSLPCLVALAQRLDDAGGDAIPLLEQLQREHPADFWTNFTLGDALRVSQPGEAVRYYQAALSIRPDAAVVHNNLGLALALDDRVDDATEQFREALRLDPSFVQPQANLGNALSILGRNSEAVEAYQQAIALDPWIAVIHSNFAKTLADVGRLDEANEQAQRAVALEPDHASGHIALGYVLNKQGRVDEAIEQDRQGIALDGKRAEAHLNLGVALLAKGRADEAVAECWLALELDPQGAHVHAGLCNALRTLGRLDEAIVHGEQAVRIDPTEASIRNDLGTALAASGRLDEAIGHFREALQLDPHLVDVHNNLGNALGQQGKFDEAIEEFQAALQLQPDSPQAHGSLGQALMGSGRLSEARDELRRGLQLFPEGGAQHAECARQLQICEGMLALENRMPAILDGSDKPTSGAEYLQCAMLCRLHGQFARAAQLCTLAFTAEPSLAGNMQTAERYNAACFAALAGSGRGTDAAESGDSERAHWRGQALQWLRADLSTLAQVLDSGSAGRRLVQDRLTHWQQDTDLTGLRDETELSRLPDAERELCRALWKDVAATLTRAQAER